MLIKLQPKDSEHPDRRANVDVYVETWLSEEEYQLAKKRNELAWQSPQSSTIDLPATTDVLVSRILGSLTVVLMLPTGFPV